MEVVIGYLLPSKGPLDFRTAWKTADQAALLPQPEGSSWRSVGSVGAGVWLRCRLLSKEFLLTVFCLPLNVVILKCLFVSVCP